MSRAVRTAAFALLTTLAAQGALAAIVTYTVRSTFLTATSATSATGTLPNLGNVGVSETLGSITITAVAPDSTDFFVEPRFDPNVNGPFVESTFSVSVYDGATLIDSVTFSRANDSLQFFGQFYTTAVVPVPAALPMLGFALAGLAGLRRAAQRRG